MSQLQAQTSSRSQVGTLIREGLETTLLALAIFVGVNTFTARFRIDGTSMDNTLQHGQYVIVNRISYKLKDPQRGELVVFVPTHTKAGTFWERIFGLPGETDFIKRIIATPGDTVQLEYGKLRINGSVLYEPYLREAMRYHGDQTWVLGSDEYFVMGDNRNFSKDSRDRDIGPIGFKQLVGKVWAIYYPFRDLQIMQHHDYQ